MTAYSFNRLLNLICIGLISIALNVSVANADVFGRIRVAVKDLDDSSAIAGAAITIHDPSRARSDILITTDAKGLAISPLLENRIWEIFAVAPGFQRKNQQFKVDSDSVGDLDLLLEPIEQTITVTSALTSLKPNQTSTATTRSGDFGKVFPVNAQNPQQLTGLLLSNPGFVADSANQVHPRGEHSATSIYIQGFQLGGAAQGRFGPLIDPQALENLDIMTGGFSPEYAGDAAILNTTVKSGSAKPFASGEMGGGTYGTTTASLTLGGQAGAPIGAADEQGYQSKIFSYFLSASTRSTNNALEAPQPRNQSTHNHGNAKNFLGRFDLNPSPSDNLSLILNFSPARTEVANRIGLPERFAPFGQGYGFGGVLSAEEAKQRGIFSQDAAEQDIYQRDRNGFGVLQWRHDLSENLSSLISIGLDQSKLDTLNNNPEIDLDNLPNDNSIEYNPEVRRNGKHQQTAASLIYSVGDHSVKVGAQYSGETADDSYQLKPASQLATDALYAADARLVGEGIARVDSAGNPLLDSHGNQIFSLIPGASAPRLDVASRGYYLAGYAQDTWKLLSDLTANYGLRFDKYHQTQNLGEDGIEADQYSPRANISWAFYPSWIARASYNRLFIEPPLSQGSIIGSSIKPERVNQYEASVQKEITARQVAKIAYYYKDIKDQVDTGLLIPSTQLGLFTSVNLDRAKVHGIEFSYDLLPDHGFGMSGYLAYAYSVAKPSGFDNTGEPVEKYNDHDQRHTLSTGVAYTFNSRAVFGVNFYYGSGLASSILTEGSSRESQQRVDLSLSSSPDLLFSKAGLKLTVSNLFDNRDQINFNSAFSGTRFEQGRAILLSSYFNF